METASENTSEKTGEIIEQITANASRNASDNIGADIKKMKLSQGGASIDNRGEVKSGTMRYLATWCIIE